MGEATNRCINLFTKCLIQIVTIHVVVGQSRNGNQYCFFWTSASIYRYMYRKRMCLLSQHGCWLWIDHKLRHH